MGVLSRSVFPESPLGTGWRMTGQQCLRGVFRRLSVEEEVAVRIVTRAVTTPQACIGCRHEDRVPNYNMAFGR
jgi:hypothetical protein